MVVNQWTSAPLQSTLDFETAISQLARMPSEAAYHMHMVKKFCKCENRYHDHQPTDQFLALLEFLLERAIESHDPLRS